MHVYHEHVSEMSLLSIVKLGEFFGLDVVDVHKLHVHGGSMRIFMRRREAGETQTPIVAQMLAEEGASGLLKQSTYEDFARRVQEMKADLQETLRNVSSLWSSGSTTRSTRRRR